MKKYQYCPWALICHHGQFGNNCVYVGDAQAAANLKFLQSQAIKTVLSIGAEAIPKTKVPGIEYFSIELRDQKTEDISQHFQKAIDIIESGRNKGNVYVHCFHGASRSSSLIIAYLIKIGKMEYDEAFQYAKSRRSSVSPNEGFIKQLQQFSKLHTSL